MSGRRLLPLVGAGIAVAAVAMASEPAHEHQAGVPVGALVFSTINLLIFVWILARFVMPSVRSWVYDRRADVIRALEDAARAKAEAERLRAEWGARLATIDRTIEEMRAQAREDAERERDRILAAARTAAEAIRKDAERVAAYEVRRTQQLLRAELVRQAVRLAEDAARSQWSAADQQRFIADFLKQVE
jgi:F-type H+-transporting ATPase subunit b